MKAYLVPLFFKSADREEFDGQLKILKELLADDVEFSNPLPLGSKLPDADGIIFPQLVGEFDLNTGNTVALVCSLFHVQLHTKVGSGLSAVVQLSAVRWRADAGDAFILRSLALRVGLTV